MQKAKIVSTKMLQVMLAVSVIGAVSGCAATQKFTQKAQAGITSVTVNPEVPMPAQMGYLNAAQMSGCSFGLLGALITSGAGNEEQASLMALMEKEDIDIGKMLVDRFKERLAERQIFSVVPQGGDAEFSFVVNAYELTWTGGGQAARLVATVNLKKANGDVVWKTSAVCGQKETGSYPYADYMKDPELLRKVWQQAAQSVADRFVDNIE